MAEWTDDHKALDYKLNYYYAQILREFERRCDIPFLNLKFLLAEELPGILKNKESIIKKTKGRMAHPFIIEYRNGQEKFLSEEKTKKILKELEKQDAALNEVKGIIACHGPKDIYQGKVKILSSARESNKIKKGDFLVATMTTPDYILAMRKAAGFITDEGGVTCHAAIVAREMNKPCIIGTKNATRILEDGDMVKINMKTGIIKKMSK